jgi:hypothetical protein
MKLLFEIPYPENITKTDNQGKGEIHIIRRPCLALIPE